MSDSLDLVARALAYPVGVGIFANGLEELIFDLTFFARGLHRRERRVITLEALREAGEKRIAIMVPAWREAEVIERMLTHNLAALEYDGANYDIFCGTYPNDPDTQRQVDAVARRAPNVHKVVVPHEGPTSKADCLNWVYQGVVLCERQRGRRFDIVLLHDSEDVIHTLSLRLYSLLMPAHEVVQTPVFSLGLPRGALIGATYVDEFAEHHLKEMPLRDRMGGLVPSAGVGTAFTRQALEDLAHDRGQRPFDPASLTEDYEIALQLRLAGRRMHFACYSLQRTVTRPARLGRGARTEVREEFIATREYFPDRLGASIRQRSRWITGIALQTWRTIGWQGSAAVLYCLWRDRKALLTNSLLALAYVLCAYVGVREVVGAAGHSWSLGSVVPAHSWLSLLLTVNLGFLGWRLFMKFRAVRPLYGVGHALLSAPRLVLGNLVSLAAMARAEVTFAHHLVTGKPLRWLKTTHAFPSPEILEGQHRDLGEFLVAQERLTLSELEEARALQRGTALGLADVLTATGLVRAGALVRALGDQLAIPALDPDPARIPASLLARLPEAEAEALDVLPLSIESDERVRVAFASPPSSDLLARLAQRFDVPVVPALAARAVLVRARRQAYRWLARGMAQPPGRRLGEALILAGHLAPAALAEALEEQSETGERLGELLVRKGLVTPERIAQQLSRDRLPFRTVRPDAVDDGALRELGYGLCAFHALVPLRPAGEQAPVASPFPLHPRVLARIGRSLGREPVQALAPGLDIRVALAHAGRRAWPQGIAASTGGLDGAELAALAEESAALDLEQLARQARVLGRSPIDWVAEAELIDGRTAARARARALGLEVELAVEDAGVAGLLPPGLVLRHQVRVQQASRNAIALAAGRPTPALADEVASLFSDCPVAWAVVAPADQERQPASGEDRA